MDVAAGVLVVDEPLARGWTGGWGAVAAGETWDGLRSVLGSDGRLADAVRRECGQKGGERGRRSEVMLAE